jgi:hypothetical protein
MTPHPKCFVVPEFVRLPATPSRPSTEQAERLIARALWKARLLADEAACAGRLDGLQAMADIDTALSVMSVCPEFRGVMEAFANERS